MRSRVIFLAAFTLMCYGTGAAFIESFVNYPSWPLIGPTEFRTFHQFITPRVVGLLVAPMVFGTVCTFVMLWIRPPAVPRWMVWVAGVLQAGMWLSTALIQVPIQLTLSDAGQDLVLLERLIVTNLWYRRVPMALNFGLFLWMALRALNASAAPGDHANTR